VTFDLTSAFAQSQGCSYEIGKRPQCASSAGDRHGVLCVAQLVGAALENRHWISGKSCVSDLNIMSGQVQTLGGSSHVGEDMVGGANDFTVTHLYDADNVTSEFRGLGGARVVAGRLVRVVTVAPEASAIIAWLSPHEGNASPLLRTCEDADLSGLANSTDPCAVNAYSSRLPGAPGSQQTFADPYWGAWGDAAPSVTTGAEAAVLETFVPLCAATGGGERACSSQPVRNFHSPVAVVPPLVEVAVTARTRRSGDPASYFAGLSYNRSQDRYLAPHPTFALKAFDQDHDRMVQYNPAFADGRSEEGAKSQELAAACFLMDGAPAQVGPWPQKQCVGGDHDGAPCNASAECDRGGECIRSWTGCRSFSDVDSNPYRRQGNVIKFDFSFGGAGSPFGHSHASGRFSQHLCATSDSGTSNASGSEGMPTPTWEHGAGAVYTIFSAFPCDSGTANQPPVFVTSATSFDSEVATDIRCDVGKACEVAIFARDFELDESGGQGGAESSDVVRIELAAGVATHEDTQLMHINGSACQGEGSVSCVLNLTSVAGSMHGNDWTGRTEVRCLVALDLHDLMAAPGKRTCRSMPLCLKVHFMPIESSDGLVPQFGAPEARVIVSPLPHVENQLRISWGRLDEKRSKALGTITIQYLQQSASVPRTLPGLSWPYSSLSAHIPFSAFHDTISPEEFDTTGVQMRFRICAAASERKNGSLPSSGYFFGPWSPWGTAYRLPPRLDTGIIYATSWQSNLVSLWRLNRGNHSTESSSHAISLIGKYLSHALMQGSVALDSTRQRMFMVISQPGDEPQPGIQLLVLALPGGAVTAAFDLNITGGSIWNVEYDEVGDMLIAASLVGEGATASSRIVSIDVLTGAVTILTQLPSSVVFAISTVDRYSRSYFFIDSQSLQPRMFSMVSGQLSAPIDLAGSSSGRVALVLGFEHSAGLLMALTCEWPQRETSPVFLERYSPADNKLIGGETLTPLRGAQVSFASFLFDFVKTECLISRRSGQLIVYNYATNSTRQELLNTSISALSLDVYEDRTPSVGLVIPSKVGTDGMLNVFFSNMMQVSDA